METFGCDLLNKYDAVLERIVGNEELIECKRGNPVIHVCSSKDFKNCLKGKTAWKEITSSPGIDIFISANKV